MNKHSLIKNAKKIEKVVDAITDVALFGPVFAAISFVVCAPLERKVRKHIENQGINDIDK